VAPPALAGPGFGLKSFEAAFENEDGTPDTQAGSHPYKVTTSMEFNTNAEATLPEGNVKDVVVKLPPGFFGDPNATKKKCTPRELHTGGLSRIRGASEPPPPVECPKEAIVGEFEAEYNSPPAYGRASTKSGFFSMTPPPGVAFQLGTHILKPDVFVNVGLPAGGDSGLLATSFDVPQQVPVFRVRTAIFGGPPLGSTRPLLTMPTACNGPLTTTVLVDSWQEPGRVNPDGSPDLSDPRWKKAEAVSRNGAGSPGGMSGCALLEFPPEITVAPDVPDASTASGLTVGVNVPQKAAFNPNGLAESALRDTTVTLPAGVAINPAGANGLEACSEGLAGFTGFSAFNPVFEPGDLTATFTPALPETLEPPQQLAPGVNFCPDSSKIGTVKIHTPALVNPLEGAVYLAAQNANPFGSLLAMYMIAKDNESGTIVKLTGKVSLCETQGEVLDGVSCEAPGQIVTTFKNTPQVPFEELELHFFGGERAPLTTPSHCGTYTTKASFTPWDGNAPVNTTSSFQVIAGPHGTPCPGQSLPFAPSLDALMTNPKAGVFSPLSTTFSREDGQQDLQVVSLHMPPGLSGLLSGVELCPEPQASQGTCGPNSLIGETIVSVGVGGDPFSVKGGRVYLTGPYKGAPFGLSIVNPAKAGPFDLEAGTPCDCVLVRAKVEVDPHTAALTITTDGANDPHPIPHILQGIPLQIKHVNVTINRPNFTFNPTNCSSLAITGSIASAEGASVPVADHFEVTNCAKLGFAPKFAVSTSRKTSKAKGASLHVKLTYPNAPFGSQANIKSVKVNLPKHLPSRLTTLQKACTAAVFNANPARCPAASLVGYAKATTPLLPVPVEGPAYFVSNGGEAFPNLIMVLQGYGVTIDLVGDTFISKAGITSSTFRSVPDLPVSTFELTLPQGRFSALTANGNLCRSKLLMPTAFTAQNGAVIHKKTKIGVTGCPKHKKAKKTSRSHHGKRRAGRKS
jgi:hypothetical protein